MLNRSIILVSMLVAVAGACAADDMADNTTTPVANQAHPHHGKHAHGKHGGHGKLDPAEHAAKLQEKLGLTDEQTAQVETALGAATHQERHAALQEILTEDQLAELDRLKAEHHGKHGSKHGKHGKHGKLDAAAHAVKLQQALSLTADQTARVEAILAESHRELEALHDQMVAAHKNGDTAKDDMAALKAEKAKLRAARTEQLAAVFTPEQLAAYEELVAKHHGGSCDHDGPCGGSCDHSGSHSQ